MTDTVHNSTVNEPADAVDMLEFEEIMPSWLSWMPDPGNNSTDRPACGLNDHRTPSGESGLYSESSDTVVNTDWPACGPNDYRTPSGEFGLYSESSDTVFNESLRSAYESISPLPGTIYGLDSVGELPDPITEKTQIPIRVDDCTEDLLRETGLRRDELHFYEKGHLHKGIFRGKKERKGHLHLGEWSWVDERCQQYHRESLRIECKKDTISKQPLNSAADLLPDGLYDKMKADRMKTTVMGGVGQTTSANLVSTLTKKLEAEYTSVLQKVISSTCETVKSLMGDVNQLKENLTQRFEEIMRTVENFIKRPTALGKLPKAILRLIDMSNSDLKQLVMKTKGTLRNLGEIEKQHEFSASGFLQDCTSFIHQSVDSLQRQTPNLFM